MPNPPPYGIWNKGGEGQPCPLKYNQLWQLPVAAILVHFLPAAILVHPHHHFLPSPVHFLQVAILVQPMHIPSSPCFKPVCSYHTPVFSNTEVSPSQAGYIKWWRSVEWEDKQQAARPSADLTPNPAPDSQFGENIKRMLPTVKNNAPLSAPAPTPVSVARRGSCDICRFYPNPSDKSAWPGETSNALLPQDGANTRNIFSCLERFDLFMPN